MDCGCVTDSDHQVENSFAYSKATHPYYADRSMQHNQHTVWRHISCALLLRPFNGTHAAIALCLKWDFAAWGAP